MSSLTVSAPEITVANGQARWRVAVDAPGLPSELWYEVGAEHQDLLSVRADAAVVALLIPAMTNGLAIEVEGVVTDELAHRAAGSVQTLLASTHGLVPVDLTARTIAPAGPRPSGVATGFSAGIDSFSVLVDHHYDPAMQPWGRLTHLLHNNVGSHLGGMDQQSLWRARHTRLRPVAERMGLPLVAVDSNLDSFFPQFPEHLDSFLETHTARNASVAHVLSGGLGRWIYASSGTGLGEVHCTFAEESSHSDPTSLPFLSTTSLTLSPHGTALLRGEKTRLVADVADAWDSLDVCGFSTDGSNCSKCAKCRRTMLTPETMGVLDRFAHVFDGDVYRAHLNDYLALVLAERDTPRKRELVGYMRSGLVDVPPSVWRDVAMRKARTSPLARFSRPLRMRVRELSQTARRQAE